MSDNVTEQSDREVRYAVEQEIDKSPGIESALIGVSVHDGVVSLTGEVPNFWQRAAATHTALLTPGVTSVANDIIVKTAGSMPTDAELAEIVRDALRDAATIRGDAVLVEVRDHVVTLTGSVESSDERFAVHQAVQSLPAVKGVVNQLGVQVRPSSVHTQIMIKSALIQNAIADAENIEVQVDGATIRLGGTVTSQAERRAAVDAAAKSSCVAEVVDELDVCAG